MATGTHFEEFEEEFDEEGQKNRWQKPKRARWTPFTILTRLLAVIGTVYLFQTLRGAYSSHDNTDPNSVDLFSKLNPFGFTLHHQATNTSTQLGRRKAVVVASVTSEDTTWVTEELPDWESNIYVADNKQSNLTVFKNKGHEGAAYLTYIISHYYALPDYVAFLHAKRYQWHNDDPMYDGVGPMKRIRLEHVKQHGYANLRCSQFPGCDSFGLNPNEAAKFEGEGAGWDTQYATIFNLFFPDQPVPDLIAMQCCAQFVVSKEAIVRTPLWKYEQIRQWLWDTQFSDWDSGRIMEYTWHILFGAPAIDCPTAEHCYCEKFGMCALKCQGDAACEGTWLFPEDWRQIPQGWPWVGQGTSDGGNWRWPVYGWWKQWNPKETYGLEYMAKAAANLTKSTSDKTSKPTSLS